VRGGAHRLDAVGLCLAGHCHRILQVARAVVEAGQDVAVEVDRDANQAIIPAGVSARTGSGPPRPE
jgi:hypothetical protein